MTNTNPEMHCSTKAAHLFDGHKLVIQQVFCQNHNSLRTLSELEQTTGNSILKWLSQRHDLPRK
jgi:hypothetical protein